MRTEVARYLREREANAEWFDGTALTARKRLYALNHVKPGERAQRILFDRDLPPDSKLFALRTLAHASEPAEQARASVENAIPYRVAVSVVKQMTPTVLLALVQRMSAQELINNLASLQRRGANDVPEVKALIDQKLEQAKTASRVSALKTSRAVESARQQNVELGEQMVAKLEQVADRQVKAKGRIKRATALLIDKSGSMSLAIELGKRIGALLSAVIDDGVPLFVYAFDTMAYAVERSGAGADLASWERALAGIRAGGGTSCGVAVELMRRAKQRVEQIVLVTDEGENTAPLLVPTLEQYRRDMQIDPSVCIVRTPGGTRHLETQLAQAGVSVDVFEFAGFGGNGGRSQTDYYSLPNLVPLLSRPGKLELLIEIMQYPLPQRRAG